MEPGAQNLDVETKPTATVPAVSQKKEAAAESTESTSEGQAPKWDAETESYIKKLRNENAKFRTELNSLKPKADKADKVSKVLSGDDEVEDPKVKVSLLEQKLNGLETRSALLESAIEFGIPKDKIGYFGYLVQEKASLLEEGEDLDLEPIAQEVLSLSKPQAPATKSVTTPKTQAETKSNDSGEISLDTFRKMGFLEKSRLQREQPDKYRALKAQMLS